MPTFVGICKSLGGWGSCVLRHGGHSSSYGLCLGGPEICSDIRSLLSCENPTANPLSQVYRTGISPFRMTSSTTSGASGNIDVTGVRVVVEWSKPNSQACYLCSSDAESPEAGQITFDCHFRPALSVASFRLRAPVLLKGLGRKITPLFVFIAPERIQSLACRGPDQTPVSEDVRKALGDGDILSMRFGLSEPADLVVPPHSPLVPKKKVFWDIFDSLKMLVQETSFVIYLKRDDLPSQLSLTSLCNAISTRSTTTSTAHADISRLYDGKGGKVLMGADLALPATAALDPPPSYDDAGPPPPAPPIEKGTRTHLLLRRRLLTCRQMLRINKPRRFHRQQ